MNAAALSPKAATAPGAASVAPKKKSKARWWLIGGGALLLIGGGVAAKMKAAHANKGIEVTVEKAAIRTIVQTVEATGKVQPEVEVKISPEVYGEITDLPFREGARVKKGEMVVKIKPDLYQAQVEQQTAALAAARSAAVLSHAKLLKADSDLKQYQDLYDHKLVSEADYLTYKTNDDVAKADFASAQATVQQNEGLLAQAQDSLSKTTIYAPMDGTVSARESEVGERVVATGSFTGTEIMRIADLSSMEVRVNVNENDIVNVKVNDPVLISIDAYPNRKFHGRVREIAASAANSGATGSGTSTQTSGSNDEVTNFVVKCRIDDTDAQLHPGMSATVDIQTQTATNVMSVPIQSVAVRAAGGLSSEDLQKKREKEAQDRTGSDLSVTAEKTEAKKSQESLESVLFVKTGDKVKMVKVTSGIADDTYIEIKKGDVKAGDEVVSGPWGAISRKLKDGSEVQLEKPKPDDNKDDKS